MPIQVATKAPTYKRPVQVMKRPEPPVAPGFNPLASQEATDAYIQHLCLATQNTPDRVCGH
jgi:hypothetical protein